MFLEDIALRTVGLQSCVVAPQWGIVLGNLGTEIGEILTGHNIVSNGLDILTMSQPHGPFQLARFDPLRAKYFSY